jgi:hypothetical protein
MTLNDDGTIAKSNLKAQILCKQKADKTIE